MAKFSAVFQWSSNSCIDYIVFENVRKVEFLQRSQYLPEGAAAPFPPFQPVSALYDAWEHGTILTGIVVRCDPHHDLKVQLGGYEGYIPRTEAVHSAISGAGREIALLSLVGRQVSVIVTDIRRDSSGHPHLTLSRRAAQEQAMEQLFTTTEVGAILPARVTHLAPFGAFVDLGCGFISLVPLENLSVARVAHPAQRLRTGQDILVTVTGVDAAHRRFYLSHKELLGTWLQNAADFSPGDTVTGFVRGIQEYGIFVELTPNLSGLAEWREDVSLGDAVAVHIRAIHSEGHKIKLQIIQKLDSPPPLQPPKYFITEGLLRDWVY